MIDNNLSLEGAVIKPKALLHYQNMVFHMLWKPKPPKKQINNLCIYALRPKITFKSNILLFDAVHLKARVTLINTNLLTYRNVYHSSKPLSLAR